MTNRYTLSHHSGRYCRVFAIALLLAGCGGGGGGGSSTTPPPRLSSISVSPGNVSIAVNTTASLNAIGSYADGSTANISTQVTWTSAASSVASVGANTGVVTGVSAGTATITAALNGVTSPAANIAVTATGGIVASLNTLATARYDHTAALLTTGPNAGKVLVAGGYGVSGAANSLNALGSAELYDPATDQWATATALISARGDQTSVTLPNGQVLLTGGTDAGSNKLSSSELYDPVTSVWSPTGSLITGRSYNSITLLANGKVLVVGGDSNTGTINTAEVYDPALVTGAVTGTWSATASLVTARNTHTATLLPGGKVLVVGGFNASDLGLASAELYDPAAGTWSPTGNLLTGVRYSHSATLLNNGKVLVVGGYGAGSSTLASAELYDPASGVWTVTGSLASARTIHTATLLTTGPNAGKVLVMGGLDSTGLTLASTELYDPTTGTWTTSGNLLTARDNFTATRLPNGKVLSAGGNGTSSVLANSELYW